MFAEVAAGASPSASGDARGKVVLGRGCDPIMAAHSVNFLPPMLGGARIVATSTDDEFLAHLRSGAHFDVVFLAPGACRWSAARRPIPGGNAQTRGFDIAQYEELVKTLLPSAKVVATAHESEVVPLLRAALGLTA